MGQMPLAVVLQKLMESGKHAVSHMHSLGWAHNDLDPHKIMVDEQGTPVLVDFGSARGVGAKFRTSPETKKWFHLKMKDHQVSDKRSDIPALEEFRKWSDAPALED